MGKLIESGSQEDKTREALIMETVKIGIQVRDRNYRNALLRGLSHESRDFQFIALKTDENGFIHGDKSDVQILLTDKDPGSEPDSGMPVVIHLTYRESYDMSYSAENMEIFRYEDAGVFVGKIIYYYARVMGIDLYFHGRRKCRTVVFFSARGGCGTTSAAMTAARFLKYRFDKKTLFMSLCPLDGSRKYTGESDGGNMTSLLYHLNAGDDVPLCKFISSQEGVSHIRGMSNNRAASEMTPGELKQLLKMIDRMGEFSYLVIDVGNHLTSLAEYVIESADVVVCVKQKEDSSGEVREKGFDNGTSRGRLINVTDLDDGRCHADSDPSAESLTYEPSAFVRQSGRTLIDIRGKYGRDVSMLAEKIVGCAE